MKPKEPSRPLLIKFPVNLIAALDEAVQKADLDRAKYVRQALREKLKREGVSINQRAA